MPTIFCSISMSIKRFGSIVYGIGLHSFKKQNNTNCLKVDYIGRSVSHTDFNVFI